MPNWKHGNQKVKRPCIQSHAGLPFLRPDGRRGPPAPGNHLAFFLQPAFPVRMQLTLQSTNIFQIAWCKFGMLYQRKSGSPLLSILLLRPECDFWSEFLTPSILNICMIPLIFLVCRILNPEKSEMLLEATRFSLAASGLQLVKSEIITGHEEGTDGWITVNFLKGVLHDVVKHGPFLKSFIFVILFTLLYFILFFSPRMESYSALQGNLTERSGQWTSEARRPKLHSKSMIMSLSKNPGTKNIWSCTAGRTGYFLTAICASESTRPTAVTWPTSSATVSTPQSLTILVEILDEFELQSCLIFLVRRARVRWSLTI